MIEEYFKIAWQNLKNRRSRSWLTMLGIFVGIASVVALVAIGQGLEKSIEEQFEMLGSDKLFVQPKGSFGAPGTDTAAKLTKEDLRVVSRTKGIAEASAMVAGYAPSHNLYRVDRKLE